MISQREAAEAPAKAAQRQRELALAIIKERYQSEERTRARELAHAKELNRIMVASWSGTRIEKRTFVPLPQLTSESELESWDSQLRASRLASRLI